MARQSGSRSGRCQGCNHLDRVRIEHLLAAGGSIDRRGNRERRGLRNYSEAIVGLKGGDVLEVVGRMRHLVP
jgi:hypothetical protein